MDEIRGSLFSGWRTGRHCIDCSGLLPFHNIGCPRVPPPVAPHDQLKIGEFVKLLEFSFEDARVCRPPIISLDDWPEKRVLIGTIVKIEEFVENGISIYFRTTRLKPFTHESCLARWPVSRVEKIDSSNFIPIEFDPLPKKETLESEQAPWARRK